MTQVNATYNVLVDLNNDGDFADANEDITAYLSAIGGFDIQVGMAQPYDRVGRSNTCKLVLNNSTHRFSPEHASALANFVRGKTVKITMTYSAVTTTLFVGRISSIQPNVFENRDRRAVVHCTGLFAEYMKDKLYLGVMEGVRSDEVIAAIITASRIKPALTAGWRIGVVGSSEMGVTTRVQSAAAQLIADEGIQSFEVIGDNWANGVSTFAALKSVAEAEWGRVFERPDGQVEFWNRQRLIEDLQNAVDGTITDANAQEMDYQYGERTVNEARVSCRHRVIDTDLSVVAVLDEDVRLKKNKPTEILLPFRNAAGLRIGAKSLVKPVPYVDFIGRKYGTDDFTRSLNIIATSTSSGVRWTIFNNSDHHVKLKAGAQQRGIKIIDYGQVQRVAYGGGGVGRFEMSIPVLEDAEVAQRLADYIINERRTDRGMVEAVSFNANISNAMMLHARNRAIGDRITVNETQTGNSGDYFIIGRRDTLRDRIHRVTFILEPAHASNRWLIGVPGFSEIGVTTRVGF